MVDDHPDRFGRALHTLDDDPHADVAPALPGAEIRRRGGRRRVRRRLAVSGVAVAAAAALVIGVGPSLARLQSAPPPVAGSPTAATPSPAPSSPTAPRLLEYGEMGVTISAPDQVDRLGDAPADFKRFIASIAVPDDGCDMVDVTVHRIRTDGFASGGFTSCGGYQTIWAVQDGRWQEILGTQDIWTCADLQRYRVPDDIAGTQCAVPGDPDLAEYDQP